MRRALRTLIVPFTWLVAGPNAEWASKSHPGYGVGLARCQDIGAGHQVLHRCVRACTCCGRWRAAQGCAVAPVLQAGLTGLRRLPHTACVLVHMLDLVLANAAVAGGLMASCHHGSRRPQLAAANMRHTGCMACTQAPAMGCMGRTAAITSARPPPCSNCPHTARTCMLPWLSPAGAPAPTRVSAGKRSRRHCRRHVTGCSHTADASAARTCMRAWRRQ